MPAMSARIELDAVEVFDARRCMLGEGPYFDEHVGRFGWVDILGSRLLCARPDGSAGGELALPGHVGAAVPRRGGGLVVCLPAGPALLEPDGTLLPLGSYRDADVAAGAPPLAAGLELRSNDAKADPAGRLWLGTMAYDEMPGAGALYRLDPGATTPVRVLGDITISNGLGWSPDGTRMYHVDTPTYRVDVFEYDLATGELGDRRPFAMIDAGSPGARCMSANATVATTSATGTSARSRRATYVFTISARRSRD